MRRQRPALSPTEATSRSAECSTMKTDERGDGTSFIAALLAQLMGTKVNVRQRRQLLAHLGTIRREEGRPVSRPRHAGRSQIIGMSEAISPTKYPKIFQRPVCILP